MLKLIICHLGAQQKNPEWWEVPGLVPPAFFLWELTKKRFQPWGFDTLATKQKKYGSRRPNSTALFLMYRCCCCCLIGQLGSCRAFPRVNQPTRP